MSHLNLTRARRGIVGGFAVMAALAVTFVSSPANAVSFSSPSGSYSVGASSATITVSGSTSGAVGSVKYLVLAQCNAAAAPGARCNGAGQLFTVAPGSSTFSRSITLNNTFVDTDTRTGTTLATSTTCQGATGDLCQIQISEYSSWPPGPGSHVGDDYVDLTFP